MPDGTTNLPAPLTAAGGLFAIPEEQRKSFCLLSDGRLLVLRSHQYNPHVQSFQARLRQLNHPFEVELVGLAELDAAYGAVRSARLDVRGEDPTQMQNNALALLRDAAQRRASDIHIRITDRSTRVLFRIDGELVDIREDKGEWGHQLASAVYQTMTDVSDATYQPSAPQDARIKRNITLPPNVSSVRVATDPQVDGNIMVMRLLYHDFTQTNSLAELGFNKHQETAIAHLRAKPQGVILIVGPTGSGKSTTLQKILRHIIRESKGAKHVITVEDPPEYEIEGAVQTPVTNAASEDDRNKAFNKAIKAAMRVDPDVIMVGEVRDQSSAELVVRAALTGHQVWATLHANDVFTAFPRLRDIGADMDLVLNHHVTTGVMSQRLVKKNCPQCVTTAEEAKAFYSAAEFERMRQYVNLDKARFRGRGCDRCNQTGVSGRTAVVEVVVMDATLSYLLRHDRAPDAIALWRQRGGRTMRDIARNKANQGLIDPFLAEREVGLFSDHDDELDWSVINSSVGAQATPAKTA